MVGNFPSAPHHKTRNALIAVLVALVLGAITAAVSPGASADDLRHKEKKVSRSIHRAAQDVDESSKALTQARARLDRSQAKLGTAQRILNRTQGTLNVARAKDARMQAALAKANVRLVKSRAQLKAAKRQVVDQRDAMGSLVAQNYQYGDPQLMGLVVILKSGSPREITSQLNTVHNLMNRQASMLDSLKSAEARAVELERRVYDYREDVEASKAATAKAVAQRLALEKRAAAERSEVAGLVSARAAAKVGAQRVLMSDKAILRKLKGEEERIKKLILKRASKSGKGYRGNSNGFLMRPLPGDVTSSYGYRKHPIYGYWGLHDGVDFRADCGQDMAAAASGKVISRYWSDVYGNRLVLDVGRVNGKSVAVIYNHATGYRFGVGQHVSRGQTIGDAGNTGWSTGCHLHFTVLVNGNSTDPMPWF